MFIAALLAATQSGTVRTVTDVGAGLQILGGAYNFAYPEDAIAAFGSDKPVSAIEASMMRYLACQQGICGVTTLAGYGSDHKAAECIALFGSAVGVLMVTPHVWAACAPTGTEKAAGAKVALGLWFSTLATLGEARRRDVPAVATVGAALLGLAGVQATTTPKVTLDLYKSDVQATDSACALLALGGANQCANVIYLAVAGKYGHGRGLFASLLANAAACARFGLFDANKAGFKPIGSLTWAVVSSGLAGLVARAL